MITKDTARDIYNCYSQLDAIDKLKEEMLGEIKRIRKQHEDFTKKGTPIPETDNSFGRFGRGCQLGIPDGTGTSMRLYNISPELAISIIDEQKEVLKRKLMELEAIVKLEMQ